MSLGGTLMCEEMGGWEMTSGILNFSQKNRNGNIIINYFRPFANLTTFSQILWENVFRIMIQRHLKCYPYVSWELYMPVSVHNYILCPVTGVIFLRVPFVVESSPHCLFILCYSFSVLSFWQGMKILLFFPPSEPFVNPFPRTTLGRPWSSLCYLETVIIYIYIFLSFVFCYLKVVLDVVTKRSLSPVTLILRLEGPLAQ